jgi:hypothetical protein
VQLLPLPDQPDSSAFVAVTQLARLAHRMFEAQVLSEKLYRRLLLVLAWHVNMGQQGGDTRQQRLLTRYYPDLRAACSGGGDGNKIRQLVEGLAALPVAVGGGADALNTAQHGWQGRALPDVQPGSAASGARTAQHALSDLADRLAEAGVLGPPERSCLQLRLAGCVSMGQPGGREQQAGLIARYALLRSVYVRRQWQAVRQLVEQLVGEAKVAAAGF